MNDLPDELLCTIFKYAIHDINQILELQLVCKRFYQLSNNGFLWYYIYKNMYPYWSNSVAYANLKQPCIDWKRYMLKLYKQRIQIQKGFKLEPILSNKKSYKIQEPFVSDIDPITNTGVVAISKYCKFTRHNSILFYSYPKYELIRKFELLFQIDDLNEWSCQIIGIQTIKINNKNVRLFAISINQPRQITIQQPEEEDNDETKTLWKVILIYQLHSNGKTTCLSHLETSNLFIGRGIWFFNNLLNQQQENITKKWLQIISPDTLNTYDSSSTIFMLAYGLSMTRFSGYSQIIQFNLLPCNDLLDPSKTVYRWHEELNRFVIANETNNITSFSKIISTFYLGGRVSCMIHFNNLNTLNHLIVTGNFLRDELSIYDWRFGVKVGIFPNTERNNSVQPWGFEFGWSIPPPPPSIIINEIDYINYGPRLIVVGDCQDKFQIKVWNISHLLKVKWDPFDHSSVTNMHNPSTFYIHWWQRGTNQLKSIIMEYEENLPYNISLKDVLRVHLLNTGINYTAYINLNTWLYLLHEDGYLSIMDIESGQILSTISTQCIAQDVNVIDEKKVIVTGKDRLLQSLLP